MEDASGNHWPRQVRGDLAGLGWSLETRAAQCAHYFRQYVMGIRDMYLSHMSRKPADIEDKNMRTHMIMVP